LVNSGSRTDHNEVQDYFGHYPGQREVPTTAVIFKLPIDGRDLLLTHDEEQLKPYLFARGVRNVYSFAYSPGGKLFGVSNSGDYDHPEDMFWLREGHHYGFPWVMGGVKNPQQFPDWTPDPDRDPLLPPFSHAFRVGYFHNDPDFPPVPEGLIFTPAVQNIGPHANYFRDPETGEIEKGDLAGKTIGTFSAHRSPLGLVFDGAFSGTAATGGFAGATIMMAMRYGMARGLFSNEAGLGSAPNGACNGRHGPSGAAGVVRHLRGVRRHDSHLHDDRPRDPSDRHVG
jgi:hypothetical protein